MKVPSRPKRVQLLLCSRYFFTQVTSLMTKSISLQWFLICVFFFAFYTFEFQSIQRQCQFQGCARPINLKQTERRQVKSFHKCISVRFPNKFTQFFNSHHFDIIINAYNCSKFNVKSIRISPQIEHMVHSPKILNAPMLHHKSWQSLSLGF